MEREWRMLGNLPFELDDVYRIILPRSYAGHLREDISESIGQLSFANYLLRLTAASLLLSPIGGVTWSRVQGWRAIAAGDVLQGEP